MLISFTLLCFALFMNFVLFCRPCIHPQANMQSELVLMRREQADRRADSSALLDRLGAEKLQLQHERDSLSVELEVLRDVGGADRASLDVERSRLKEAMAVQQSMHMEKLMEKEDTLYGLHEECAGLKDELLAAQGAVRGLRDDVVRLQAGQLASSAQLAAAKDLQLDLESKNDALSRDHSRLLGDIEGKDEELRRLNEVETILDKTKNECESNYKRYENEHAHTSNLEEQLQELRAQLVDAHSANITSSTEHAALQREFDQLQMSSDTAARLATEHVNRVRRRSEVRERELLDALTTADQDVVLARREAAQQKDQFAKDCALQQQREADLAAKIEQSKEAYASLSKSKHTSESISNQQTTHLQAEVSRLMQVVSEMQKLKLESDATVADLETKCGVLSAEKNGVHATLSKQLNNQVVLLKEQVSTLTNDLEMKSTKCDEVLCKLSAAEQANEQSAGQAEMIRAGTVDSESKLMICNLCYY
jgi:hypothetical protein